jgi:hypothetical protein
VQSASEQSIPLSVVVATTQAWPEVTICLDSLHEQAVAEHAEVLVVDGHGGGLPDSELARYPEVTRLLMPQASAVQMRTAAMLRARGDIVAITEDHCRLAPGWCRRILDAHREYPEAAAIGGVVENGSDETVAAWANFFISNGQSMPPVPNGIRSQIAMQASVSYKRRFLPREVSAMGKPEWMLNRDLRRRGEMLVSDDRILVHHVQPYTFRKACAIHFHDSRSVAGLRLEEIGNIERVVRLAACAAMPPLLFLRTVVPILSKRRHRDWLMLSLPMIARCSFIVVRWERLRGWHSARATARRASTSVAPPG